MITHGYDDVLRFTTKEIRTNLEGCLDQIEERVRAMDMVRQRQREREASGCPLNHRKPLR